MDTSISSYGYIVMTENTNFFNKDKLSQMKNGSILINTSRAALVSEDALYEEIDKGRLEAAFDVFWEDRFFFILNCSNTHL